MGFKSIIVKEMVPFFFMQKWREVITLVWVKPVGLLLEFWLLDVLKAIQNALGVFYEVDHSFQESSSMAIARIPVGLDLREGLVDRMTLKKGDMVLEQSLDNVELLFHCLRCHAYGHLVVDYKLPFRNKVWVQKSHSAGVLGEKYKSNDLQAPIGLNVCKNNESEFEDALGKGPMSGAGCL
jgi:hypothetical protein